MPSFLLQEEVIGRESSYTEEVRESLLESMYLLHPCLRADGGDFAGVPV